MRKKILLLLIGCTLSVSNAQDINDALNYSLDNLQGTARYRGLSGAFGALGGDLSAININPAGSAVFKNSYVTGTLSSLNAKNNHDFLGNTSQNSVNNIDLNQAGAVFVFNNRNENNDWKKFVLGVNYEQTMNYNNDFFVSGTNNNSIDSYFLNYAQGVPLELLQLLPGETITDLYTFLGQNEGFGAQQAFLGYQSFILEPVDDTDPNNTAYFSNIAPGDFNQEYTYATSGYASKFSLNLASQYKDKIYVGMNLNSHFLNYNKSTYLYESNTNPGSIVNEVGFENNLSTIGSGFSFQLGTIAKVHKNLRLGVSYESPTWYRISEEATQYIATTRNDSGNNITEAIAPNTINVYPTYRLQTPSELNASAAILFGKKGLISFDYTLKDYASTKFKPSSDAGFAAQNTLMANVLKATNSYRIGGELRVNRELSLRAGYRFEESPYINENTISDLTGYSLGLGYNFGKVKIDAAFDQFEQTRNVQMYSQGLTNSNRINGKNSNITLSVSFNL